VSPCAIDEHWYWRRRGNGRISPFGEEAELRMLILFDTCDERLRCRTLPARVLPRDKTANGKAAA